MTFPGYSLDGKRLDVRILKVDFRSPPSRFPKFRAMVALLRSLLSIMAGAYRGLGPPGRKFASSLSILIASALRVEVSKKCLLIA
jgi:hypothetical protein